ncbi:cyclin-domain-containing protein [Cryphonectria parasitica EP155]|uniref:Cyclin-domain-containing protein n=1 Tax=Cryphonectria parasitica (strain ATCC 38755 / EP155) TaxID=660469 RepID=A0A9P4YA28_CRYP1|nr:cyclin-domain-containing protein [Cryphonectria parasitica EP155]KAF3769717.1 cyclin-domain-containing protein [Cryphonectria parasitica EP155]
MAEDHNLGSGDQQPVPKSPPPPPNPSTDPRLIVQPPPPNLQQVTSPQLGAQPDDIFQVPALAALKLLSAGVEALVRITGDIPPTPPPTTPHVPHMRGMQAEKESIVRNYSEKSLARLREQEQSPGLSIPTPSRAVAAPIDGVYMKPTQSPEPGAPGSFAPPTSSTPTSALAPEPYVVIGANSQPLNLQHSAITRKFYSKKPPPIGIADYLLRIHRFCPMSTAVYLATSLYIHRLAVDERAVAVTKRNAHRLLLAGLRVAMKALEDLSYPHAKVAKVGGVSELELARLEISFCFLCGFELVVGAAVLQEHWATMKNGPDLGHVGGGGGGAVPGMKLNLKIPTHPGTHGRFSH